MSWIQERHVVGLLDIEARGRLVEQQQLGIGAQRVSQLGRHLPHPVGEVDDEAVAVLLQVEELDHLSRPLRDARSPCA